MFLEEKVFNLLLHVNTISNSKENKKKKCKLFSIKTSCHTVFFLYIAYYFVVHYPANECHEYKNKIISVLYNINISIELSYKQILILELNSKKEVFFVKNK